MRPRMFRLFFSLENVYVACSVRSWIIDIFELYEE